MKLEKESIDDFNKNVYLDINENFEKFTNFGVFMKRKFFILTMK